MVSATSASPTSAQPDRYSPERSVNTLLASSDAPNPTNLAMRSCSSGVAGRRSRAIRFRSLIASTLSWARPFQVGASRRPAAKEKSTGGGGGAAIGRTGAIALGAAPGLLPLLGTSGASTRSKSRLSWTCGAGIEAGA